MSGEMWIWCMDYCSKNRLPVGENWAWELAKRRYTEENGGAVEKQTIEAYLVTGPYTRAAFSDLKTAQIYRNGLLSGHPDGGYRITPLTSFDLQEEMLEQIDKTLEAAQKSEQIPEFWTTDFEMALNQILEIVGGRLRTIEMLKKARGEL